MHPAHGVQVSSWHFWSGLAGPVAQCSRLSAHRFLTLEHCVCQETARASKAVQPLKQPPLISEGSQNPLQYFRHVEEAQECCDQAAATSTSVQCKLSCQHLGREFRCWPITENIRKWNHATMQCLWASEQLGASFCTIFAPKKQDGTLMRPFEFSNYPFWGSKFFPPSTKYPKFYDMWHEKLCKLSIIQYNTQQITKLPIIICATSDRPAKASSAKRRMRSTYGQLGVDTGWKAT